MTKKKENTDKVKKEEQEMAEEVKAAKENAQEVEDEKKEDEMVTIPLKEYASQLEEIDHLNQKADEFSDGWQRERADFANYKKDIGRRMDAQKVNFKVETIKKYLAVKDDIDRALKNLPESLTGEPWVSGIELINQKLSNILEGEGIEVIPAEGKAFDPVMHEAVSHEENKKVKSGNVIEVVQQGYKLGERIIRPSLVRVAK
jgi:molecular chaperone GrpE